MLLSSVTEFSLFVRSNQKQLFALVENQKKKKTEPNELDELKYSKKFNQTTSFAHWHAFLYVYALIKTFFILFKIKEKEQAKWAEWAKMLKNALTDEQLCS